MFYYDENVTELLFYLIQSLNHQEPPSLPWVFTVALEGYSIKTLYIKFYL